MYKNRKHLSFLKNSSLAFLLFSILLVACAPSSITSSAVSPTATATTTVSGTQMSGCISSPKSTVNDRTFYVGDIKADTPPLHTSVYALDAQSGATRWSNVLVPSGQDSQYQFLQVVGGVVYVAYATSASTSYTDTVDALQAKDGRLLWHYHLADRYEDIHTMVVCNGTVYLGITRFGPSAVAATASTVEALQAKDARPLWHYSTNDSSYGDQLEVTDTMLYLITAKNVDAQNFTVLSTIHALHANNGGEAWHTTYKTYGISVVATATNSVIYVIIPVQKYVGNGIDALQASDGTLLWHTKASLGGAIFRKAVTGDLLYLNANDRLCAFSVTNGALRWCSDEAHDAALHGSGGVIYTTTAQQACALRASDGKKLWCVTYPNLGSTIIASNTTAYIASNVTGTLYALRKSDGSKLWYRQLDHFIFALAFNK